MTEPPLSFEEFQRIDMRIVTIKNAVPVEGSGRLLKLTVDCGEEVRTIVAGIGGRFMPQELIDSQIIIIANLAPRMLMGIESKGMLLATDDEHGPVLLRPLLPVRPGSRVH